MSNSLFRRKNIDTILKDAAKGDADAHGHGLKRVLTLKDLTFFGIAAIIGAGSFSSLGDAIFKGGPGVVILFIICGIACGFTAFCYAEFASRIPVAGSAYTYAYASFGELFAWIIGWALLMEYSIGNIYVAYSWSDYFTSLLSKLHIHIPDYLHSSYSEVHKAILNGTTKPEYLNAWNNAPMIGSLRIILDLPAFIINILITMLVYIGVKESRNFSNAMVIIKLAVVALVIFVPIALGYVNTANWTPETDAGVRSFMPNGFGGVMIAVSGVFFAYIGFDAVSVLAEESKNPQRDLPRGMILSLVICTIVYILLTLVLTGVLNYSRFEGVGDPLAKIFEVRGNDWMQFLVAICAVVAMTSVLLVFQMGQPRIWMSMSRDGLLPKKFQTIHPRFQTPSFATIITGLLVGLPILFTDRSFVLDFTSIGTLFAFVLVCGGVLMLPRRQKEPGKFNLPFINAKYIFPALLAGALALVLSLSPGYFNNLLRLNLNTEQRTEIVDDYARATVADISAGLPGRADVDVLFPLVKTDKEPVKLAFVKGLEVNDQLKLAVEAFFSSQVAKAAAYGAVTGNTYSNEQLLEKPFGRLDAAAASAVAADSLLKHKASFVLMQAAQVEELKKYAGKDSSLIDKIDAQAKLNQALASATDTSKAVLAEHIKSVLFGTEQQKILAEKDFTGVKKDIDAANLARRTLNFSTLVFWLVCVLLAVFAYVKKWSLLPLMGLVSCLYLLTGMAASNWKWFFIWFAIGFVIYMLYGYRKSKLAINQPG